MRSRQKPEIGAAAIENGPSHAGNEREGHEDSVPDVNAGKRRRCQEQRLCRVVGRHLGSDRYSTQRHHLKLYRLGGLRLCHPV